MLIIAGNADATFKETRCVSPLRIMGWLLRKNMRQVNGINKSLRRIKTTEQAELQLSPEKLGCLFLEDSQVE